MIKMVTYCKGRMLKETVLEPFSIKRYNKREWVVSFIQDHITTYNPSKQQTQSVRFKTSDDAYKFYEELTSQINCSEMKRFIVS